MIENEKDITNIDLSKVTDDGMLPEGNMSEEELREYESILQVKQDHFKGMTMTEAQIEMGRILDNKFKKQKQKIRIRKELKKAMNRHKKAREAGEFNENCIEEKSTE